MDIISRVKTFRTSSGSETPLRKDVSWAGIACTLLRKAGNMGLDRHLFLMEINKLDLAGLTPFYRSLFKVWTLFKFPES